MRAPNVHCDVEGAALVPTQEVGASSIVRRNQEVGLENERSERPNGCAPAVDDPACKFS